VAYIFISGRSRNSGLFEDEQGLVLSSKARKRHLAHLLPARHLSCKPINEQFLGKSCVAVGILSTSNDDGRSI
jgi:hypothetical protein